MLDNALRTFVEINIHSAILELSVLMVKWFPSCGAALQSLFAPNCSRNRMTPYCKVNARDTELGGVPTSSPAESASVTAFPHLADIFLEMDEIFISGVER